MIVLTTIRDLIGRMVGMLSPGTVTGLLLALSALFAYLALFAPVDQRRRWLGLAL